MDCSQVVLTSSNRQPASPVALPLRLPDGKVGELEGVAMRKSLIGSALISAVALSGCAKDMVYVRLDGQRSSNDPVLAQQFEIDRTICAGEMQKANVSGVTFSGGGLAGAVAAAERSNAVGQVAQGCMAQKGYVIVPRDKAQEKLAEFAAVTEEKKRREEATQRAEAARLAAVVAPKKKKQSTAATGN